MCSWYVHAYEYDLTRIVRFVGGVTLSEFRPRLISAYNYFIKQHVKHCTLSLALNKFQDHS